MQNVICFSFDLVINMFRSKRELQSVSEPTVNPYYIHTKGYCNCRVVCSLLVSSVGTAACGERARSSHSRDHLKVYHLITRSLPRFSERSLNRHISLNMTVGAWTAPPPRLAQAVTTSLSS